MPRWLETGTPRSCRFSTARPDPMAKKKTQTRIDAILLVYRAYSPAVRTNEARLRAKTRWFWQVRYRSRRRSIHIKEGGLDAGHDTPVQAERAAEREAQRLGVRIVDKRTVC